jgi:hypothetical protein
MTASVRDRGAIDKALALNSVRRKLAGLGNIPRRGATKMACRIRQLALNPQLADA